MGGNPQQVDATTRVRRPAWVAHVRDGDITVLLHLPSGRRLGLPAEGTAVWQQVLARGAEGVDAAEITQQVAPAYAGDPQVIEADVVRLLVDLLSADLVEVVVPEGVVPEGVEP